MNSACLHTIAFGIIDPRLTSTGGTFRSPREPPSAWCLPNTVRQMSRGSLSVPILERLHPAEMNSACLHTIAFGIIDQRLR
jgi:hypothetical protein